MKTEFISYLGICIYGFWDKDFYFKINRMDNKICNMRPSSYNILVKVDNEAECYVLLNGYTRAFDIVNRNVYQYLRAVSHCEISDKTKEKLIKRGYMTSMSEDEERELVRRILNRVYDEIRLKKYNFHFIISYDCNLRCIYCYEDLILNGGTCLSKKKITKDQVDKAFEIIVEKDDNKKGQRIIALYGGEPFLATNRELIEYIVEKGKALGYTFSVTSNGYDIDKYLDFIAANKIFSFQITIDGVEDIQNARKPHFQNNDSFSKITSNIDKLLKLGISVSIRINTDPYTMERLDELLYYFNERGWCEYKKFSSYCALLRNDISMKNDNSSLKKRVFTQYAFYEAFFNKDLFKRSHGKMVCQDHRVQSVLKDLLMGKYVPYKSCFCGAQSSNLIFDPMGDIYSCWDVVGNKKYRVGEYMPEFKLNDELSKIWFDSRVGECSCVKCKYVFFCGGGCIASSMRAKGKVQSGNCNDYPKLFNYELQQIYEQQIKMNLNEE